MVLTLYQPEGRPAWFNLAFEFISRNWYVVSENKCLNFSQGGDPDYSYTPPNNDKIEKLCPEHQKRVNDPSARVLGCSVKCW